MNGNGRNSLHILYIEGVTKSFDGFKALNDLNFYIERGELRAVIGPNGAGKTTMMDVITGKVRPDTGRVEYDGRVDLTRHDEAQIAELGIGRKFQKPTVFENHTVWDNLDLAMAGDRRPFLGLWQRLSRTDRDMLEETLAIIGLEARAFDPAGSLSHGQKQWLEIGMLLCQAPKLMLVDEPAAGMTDAETEHTAELLRSLAGKHAVVVVEHDMAFVRALDCRVTVLHEGAAIAEGSIDSVSANRRVIEVYLGR
ncbi:MAG: urea ABC transporter ATP-binding protein UrtD [Geminicoccaceae bacterium]|nr:urea ABC transporter ATP-binding protein UrtD [Geminicoccaceae bacterium]